MLRLLALLIPLIVPMVLLALTSPRDGAPRRADNTGADRAPAPGAALDGPALQSEDHSSADDSPDQASSGIHATARSPTSLHLST
jgi:hypothetical protein